MGGIAFDALAAQQSQQPPQVPSDSTQTTILPQSAGYGSDIASSFPAAMPLGGTADLENRASQTFQQPQPQPQQQPQQPDPNVPIAAQMRNRAQIPPQMPQLSPDNPYSSLVQDSFQKWQQLQPKPPGGGVKGLLTTFFSGMGSSMMGEAG
jgi:hypothetical protein